MSSSLMIKALEIDPINEAGVFIGGNSKKNDYLEHLDLEIKKRLLKSDSISSQNTKSI